MANTSFNPDEYLAANPDLIRAFGHDREKATKHYTDRGQKEGRATTFNEAEYLAANPDILSTSGNDPAKALEHFIEYGFQEGRKVQFSEDDYLAANPDLLDAFGTDKEKALKHFLEYGHTEGRKVEFDEDKYLAANPDLLAAFAGDEEKALKHFLEHGHQEGRRTQSASDDKTPETHDPDLHGKDDKDTKTVTTDDHKEDDDKTKKHGAIGPQSDNAEPGKPTGFDPLRDFQPGTDTVVVSGAPLTMASPGRALATAAHPINDGFAALRSTLGSAMVADDCLVVASDGLSSAPYAVHSNGSGTLGASDIRMPGLCRDAVLSAADVVAG